MTPWGRIWCGTCAALVLLLPGLAGCGSSDGLPRESISGTITLDAKPIEKGFIEFRPVAQEPVTLGAALIQNGQYLVPRPEGLVPGTYQVSITARVAPDNVASDGSNAAPAFMRPKELVPARYNEQTTLSVEVKQGAPNVFNYELQTK
jgi:hypothetical protein